MWMVDGWWMVGSLNVPVIWAPYGANNKRKLGWGEIWISSLSFQYVRSSALVGSSRTLNQGMFANALLKVYQGSVLWIITDSCEHNHWLLTNHISVHKGAAGICSTTIFLRRTAQIFLLPAPYLRSRSPFEVLHFRQFQSFNCTRSIFRKV